MTGHSGHRPRMGGPDRSCGTVARGGSGTVTRVTLALMQGRAQNLSAVLHLLAGFRRAQRDRRPARRHRHPRRRRHGDSGHGGVAAFNDLPSDFEISPWPSSRSSTTQRAAPSPTPTTRTASSSPGEDLPWMQKAQIAIEDSRFYQHGGLDLRGFTRALVSNFSEATSRVPRPSRSGTSRSPSRENALRSGDKEAAQAATAKNYMRKAPRVEVRDERRQNFTKDQILAGYLNLVYYGDQAWRRSGFPELLRHPPPPTSTSARPPCSRASSSSRPSSTRCSTRRTPSNGVTSCSPGWRSSGRHPRRSPPPRPWTSRRCCTRRRPRASATAPRAPLLRLRDGLAGEVPADGRAGCDPGRATQEHQPGRLKIRTTLNPTMQSIAVQRVTEAVPTATTRTSGGGGHGDRARHRQGAGDGAVLGLPTPPRSWNADFQYGGARAGWQFGSHSEGLRTRDGPRTRYAAQQRDLRAAGQPPALRLHQGPGHRRLRHGQAVEVENDYSVGGEMSLQKATSQSINTAFAALTLSLGGCSVRDTMTKMGLHSSDGQPIEGVISAITLGAGTTTP